MHLEKIELGSAKREFGFVAEGRKEATKDKGVGKRRSFKSNIRIRKEDLGENLW